MLLTSWRWFDTYTGALFPQPESMAQNAIISAVKEACLGPVKQGARPGHFI
jgi:hypothetical protein